MNAISRHDVVEEWAVSGIVDAGGFVFISYCVGNPTGTMSEQVHGAVDTLERRLSSVGLTLADVVKVDALFADVWELPIMEEVFQERFVAGYPARKSIQTVFAHDGLRFQLDAIAARRMAPETAAS